MEERAEISRNEQRSDPSPGMTFIFIMVIMVYWAMFAGVITESTEILMGCIQLAVFPGYLLGACMYYKRGDTLSATLYLMFATVFGLVGGLMSIAVHFSNIFGWGLDHNITVIPLLWASLTLIPIMIAYRKAPAAIFLVYGVASLFLLLFSLCSLGWMPTGVMITFQWLALFIVVGGFYIFADGVLKSVGDKGLPLGPPLFKK